MNILLNFFPETLILLHLQKYFLSAFPNNFMSLKNPSGLIFKNTVNFGMTWRDRGP